MPFDWSEYESDSDTEEVSLLLSVKSQSLILSAMQSLQFRSNWLEIDDATYDDIEAAVAEAYEEIMRVAMPDFTPVGTIIIYAGSISSIPEKWLLCDGSIVLAADYPELALVLPVPFDTGTNIDLPDLRSRFVYGASVNTDLGDIGGLETHTLTEAEIPPHVHSIAKGNATGNTARAIEADASAASLAQNTGSTGGGAAHNNMPPYMKLFYIIKALP